MTPAERWDLAQRVARYHARRYLRPGVSLDELEAVAVVALYEAAPLWRPDGLSWLSFSRWPARKALSAHVRELAVPVRVPQRCPPAVRAAGASEDDPEGIALLVADGAPADDLADTRRERARLLAALAELRDDEAAYVRARWLGEAVLTNRAACAELGLSKYVGAGLATRALANLRARLATTAQGEPDGGRPAIGPSRSSSVPSGHVRRGATARGGAARSR